MSSNVDAASSRIRQRQDAAATMIGYFDPDEPVANLIRNLPHWRQKGVTYFVTFRCADALPQEKLDQWNQELVAWLRSHPEPRDLNTRREILPKISPADAGMVGCGVRRMSTSYAPQSSAG